MDAWGGWFMFALFAGILIWEEVWDLPNSAALSGWLLILITAGAVIFSAIFERRLWCKHLCPIGAMNGLFAKGSITELRATQGVCTSELTDLVRSACLSSQSCRPQKSVQGSRKTKQCLVISFLQFRIAGKRALKGRRSILSLFELVYLHAGIDTLPESLL